MVSFVTSTLTIKYIRDIRFISSLSNPRKLVRTNWPLTGVIAHPLSTILALLPFLMVAQHESGTRTVTKKYKNLKFIQSTVPELVFGMMSWSDMSMYPVPNRVFKYANYRYVGVAAPFELCIRYVYLSLYRQLV